MHVVIAGLRGNPTKANRRSAARLQRILIEMSKLTRTIIRSQSTRAELRNQNSIRDAALRASLAVDITTDRRRIAELMKEAQKIMGKNRPVGNPPQTARKKTRDGNR